MTELLKDTIIVQEDPSSSECKTAIKDNNYPLARNEMNKDEIEGIVAQIVESSKRVKSKKLKAI